MRLRPVKPPGESQSRGPPGAAEVRSAFVKTSLDRTQPSGNLVQQRLYVFRCRLSPPAQHRTGRPDAHVRRRDAHRRDRLREFAFESWPELGPQPERRVLALAELDAERLENLGGDGKHGEKDVN